MNYPRLTSLSAMLLAASMISACGDDDESFSDAIQDRLAPVNTAPEAGDQSLSANENGELDITLTGSDADGDALTFTVTAQPGNGALSGTAPNLTYTPDTGYSGSDSFTFTVNDGSEDSAEATVNIAVNQFYFSIGGTVTNNLTPVTLENNGGEAQEVAGVSFEFPTKQTDGSDYAVTVADHPEQQLCSVDAATGTVDGADVDLDVLCRYWRTAGVIDNGGADAVLPQIAVNSAGDAIALWSDTDNNIYANHYTPGNGWDATATEIGNGVPAGQQIAVDSAGNAIAIWVQQTGPDSGSILFNYYSADTGSWGTAAAVDTVDDELSPPDIVFDSAGDAIAVWATLVFDSDTFTTQFEIHATHYTDNSWDTSATVIASGDGYLSIPQIAGDGAGNATVVWGQEGDGSIYASHYTDNSWDTTATEIASNVFTFDTDPQLAVDGAGNAIVVWHQEDVDAGRFDIRANTYSADSGDWGTAGTIETSDDDGFDPQIAVNSAGDAIAVWQGQDVDTGELSIWANTYSPDSDWGTASLIAAGDVEESMQVAVDSAGNGIAVWPKFDDTQDNIWASTYSPGGGWDTPAEIETSGGNASAPQIVFDGAGNATAIWVQDVDTVENVWANRFE